ELIQRLVQPRAAVRRIGQVAVACVPLGIALEEQDVVSAQRERAHERTVGGRVTVPPRRSNRQSEDDDVHADTAPGMAGRIDAAMLSNSSTRCPQVCRDWIVCNAWSDRWRRRSASLNISWSAARICSGESTAM